MPIHYCPVCGAAHEVHPIHHALAYGRQLTCSPRCKTDFPHVICPRLLAKAANDATFADKPGQEQGNNSSINCVAYQDGETLAAISSAGNGGIYDWAPRKIR